MTLTPDYQPDPDDARAALEESRQANRRATGLLAEVSASLSIVRAHREANHYTEKFRDIIRGLHA